MKIAFRQGIIRYQSEPNGLPTFLKKSGGGSSLDLIVSPDPTIVTMAYRSANYLHEESATVLKAWSGLQSGVSYWLYIDIDMVTAQRTFGYTLYEPSYGTKPPTGVPEDYHWFDVVSHTMKVWNGISWSERIRVFLAQYEAGSIIKASGFGSQVNINTSNDAGFILFDSDGYPVRKNHNRKTFEFVTTSSIFTSVTAKSINLTLDAICTTVRALEPIPAFSLVARTVSETGQSGIKVADSKIGPNHSIGLVQEDFFANEVGIITQSGYIHNEQWSFSETPGTILFLGLNGQLTSNPPQTGFIQIVGEVVSVNSIKLDLQQPVRYIDYRSAEYKNLIPLVMDKVTGEAVMAADYNNLPIAIVTDLLKDASKLPVTALGGNTLRLEQWTANLSQTDLELTQRIAALEAALAAMPVVDLDVDYKRTTPTTIAVGGALIGSTFDGTVQDALDKILYPFGVPSFTAFALRDAQTVVEVGSTQLGGMQTFTWATSNPQNIRAKSIGIKDITTSTPLAAGLDNTGSLAVQIGADIVNNSPAVHVWGITGLDTQGGAMSRNFSVTWRWKVYYGNNMSTAITGEQVLALANSSLPSSGAGSYVMPATGYKWLCYPSIYPTLTTFKDQATGLNVAVNDPTIVSVTNKFGLTQTYKCHRTYNMLGGSITIVGS